LHVKQWLSRGELWDDAPEKGRALQTLFRYVGVIVALGLAVYGLAVVGEVLRDHTPGDLHEGLAAAGAGLTTAAVIGLAAFRVPPFSISVRAWRMSMFGALAAGLILFCFYVANAECHTTGRSNVSCSFKSQ
jgi:hypothetical protein